MDKETQVLLAVGALLKCSEEGCEETAGNNKWGKIKAVGWFFSKQDDRMAYCPEHLPEWVSSWRASQKGIN